MNTSGGRKESRHSIAVLPLNCAQVEHDCCALPRLSTVNGAFGDVRAVPPAGVMIAAEGITRAAVSTFQTSAPQSASSCPGAGTRHPCRVFYHSESIQYAHVRCRPFLACVHHFASRGRGDIAPREGTNAYDLRSASAVAGLRFLCSLSKVPAMSRLQPSVAVACASGLCSVPNVARTRGQHYEHATYQLRVFVRAIRGPSIA